MIKKYNYKSFNSIFVGTLGVALGIRQMAMTMVMPFLSTYSNTLKYNTPMLAGIALGVFGLMQALFQIPYGIWSDKKGNKIVMVIGLLQVGIGLVIAYFANNIYWLIFARAMQGSGAIIAVGYSWISSTITDQKERMKSMSIISTIIGVAAAFSFAFGPLIHKFVSVKDMFLYSAIIIFIAWFVIVLFLKDTKNIYNEETMEVKDAIRILSKDKSFIALNIAALINNFIMTAIFFSIPQYLEKITGIDGMWKIFMPTVIVAIIVMRIVVRRLNNSESVNFLISAFVLSALGVLFYLNKDSFISIFIGTLLFMIGYISISTIIPVLGNCILEDEYRGTGNGIINSLQYIGSFLGSSIIAAIWVKSEKCSFIVTFLVGLLGALIVKKYVNKEKFYER
ncbi:MFS transporter [Clostridium butyricum]|uniref:MFS transporter n=1 Tax=Clostridium butyricum TaxID=1492 RepID=UPI0013D2854D|nr:MFS transporter [Clostridium butyricum]MCQ2016679.1 MFS transporter [Clostridium butyricum]MCQ2020582.1 MFS transporter [Clostridium butyricum]NFB69665.1 MFS transporter [Clostridium butyricum]NFB90280.1 MFS transporter [Clostridium butyricum]UTY54251.1 MFS transporter [Clostridium butyricum]